MKNSMILDSISQLIESQNFGVLATQGREYPYCSLVGVASTKNLKEIIFATIRDTRKFKNLHRSPKVSLLIDSQTNCANDIKDAKALTVIGTSIEIDNQDKERYLTIYLKKLPYLEDFVKSPNCALIKIIVSKYIFVEKFQNVMEYSFE